MQFAGKACLVVSTIPHPAISITSTNTSHTPIMSSRTPTLLRTLITSSRRPLARLPKSTAPIAVRPLLVSPITTQRTFTTTPYRLIDILPDSDKPDHEVKESEPHDVLTEATPLTDAEYQEKSDAYIEELLGKLETMQEEKGNMDVEYSVSNFLFSRVRCARTRRDGREW